MSTGVVEIKHVLKVTESIVVFLIRRLKDGVGMDDLNAVFSELASDPDFKKLFQETYANIGSLPAELKDLSWIESFDLTMTLMQSVPKFISAAKKV